MNSPKKKLTYSRNVNSIDSALDETNYHMIELPEERKRITGYLPSKHSNQKKKKSDKIEIHFSNHPPQNVGRQGSQNVIKNKPDVHGNARNAATERQAFEVFFTEEMMGNVVTFTNKKIEKTLEQIENDEFDASKNPHVKPVDSIDLYAVVGLMYFRGLYGLNQHDIRLPFSDVRGIPVFGATMSRLHFQFIIAYLTFDDFEIRAERWKTDRFAAIRGFFEDCNDNFGAALVPEDYISLDETLYPMRTQVNFKQYNPDKPAKYGLLFKSLNCARYPYTHQSHVYCGKPVEQVENNHYVQGTINYIKYLFEKLSAHHSLQGRNITMDRLYSSFEIAELLHERKVTMVGTMQSYRVGIPASIKDTKDREDLSSEIYWEEEGVRNISSYVVKSLKGKKNVLLLSTLDPILGVTKDDEKQKPALY